MSLGEHRADPKRPNVPNNRNCEEIIFPNAELVWEKPEWPEGNVSDNQIEETRIENKRGNCNIGS